MSQETSSLITEKELQSTVLGWAKAYGWLVYHQVDMGFKDPETGKYRHSRRIGPGFPDLVLVHPRWGRLIFAELKTDKGKVSDNQQEWLDALDEVKGSFHNEDTNLEVYVWRAKDMNEIERELMGCQP